jgi:hypothetical protein
MQLPLTVARLSIAPERSWWYTTREGMAMEPDIDLSINPQTEVQVAIGGPKEAPTLCQLRLRPCMPRGWRFDYVEA